MKALKTVHSINKIINNCFISRDESAQGVAAQNVILKTLSVKKEYRNPDNFVGKTKEEILSNIATYEEAQALLKKYNHKTETVIPKELLNELLSSFVYEIFYSKKGLDITKLDIVKHTFSYEYEHTDMYEPFTTLKNSWFYTNSSNEVITDLKSLILPYEGNEGPFAVDLIRDALAEIQLLKQENTLYLFCNTFNLNATDFRKVFGRNIEFYPSSKYIIANGTTYWLYDIKKLIAEYNEDKKLKYIVNDEIVSYREANLKPSFVDFIKTEVYKTKLE